jgi:hypothetical protein
MTRDRSDEIKPPAIGRLTSRQDDEGPERRSFANAAALVAVLAIVALGYWVFQALDHSRTFQRCLDSGHRNCVDFVSADR